MLDTLDQNKKPGQKGGNTPIAGQSGDVSFNIHKSDLPFKFEDVKFKLLSPTRVEMTNLDPKDKKEQKAEARWEDGRWRLHIGDLKTLLEQNKIEGMKLQPPGTEVGKPKP